MTIPSSSDPDAHALAIFTSLGRFIVSFEKVCAAMRQCIHIIFHREGLKNQGLSQVVVNGKPFSILREVLAATYSELRDQDKDDRAIVAKLLIEVNALAEERNRLLHAEWFTNSNYEGATDEFIALTIKLSASQKDGAYFVPVGVSAASLECSKVNATRSLARLKQLAVCLNQSGYKVSEFLARPL